MKPLNKETLKIAAHKLLFEMKENEYDTLLSEFETVSKQMEIYNRIPHLDEASPMVFPFEVSTTYLREDVVEAPLSKEEVLENASDVLSGQIKLPKVIK